MKKLILILCFIQMVVVSAQDVYLHCGQLIDTEKGKVLTKKTIIVSGKTIKSIQNGYVDSENTLDIVVDLK